MQSPSLHVTLFAMLSDLWKERKVLLTLKVVVATIDAQWEGM